MFTVNEGKNYFAVNSTKIEVDTDGVEDVDERDYRVILHEPLNSFQDFTHGHVTPVAKGAPGNSWAYDEFTIPNIVEEPIVYHSRVPVLKHAWFPARKTWHNPRETLIIETEQAYRFVKKITDAGGAITYATTTDFGLDKRGYLMKDEMAIMETINNRLLMENVPDFEPYVRPLGAFLTTENKYFLSMKTKHRLM